MTPLNEQFGDGARFKDFDSAQRHIWLIKRRNHEAQKLEAQEQAEDTDLGLASVAIEATENQIAAFNARMDYYEARLDRLEGKLDLRGEAITKAMIENRGRYDQLIDQREQILEVSHTLEDGRKVFKSADGQTVHFEDGSLVPDYIITPNQLPDDNHPYEALEKVEQGIKALEDEFAELERAEADIEIVRDRILNARDKIAEGRDAAKGEGITPDDLDALDEEINELMPGDALPPLPTSATKYLSGNNEPQNAPALQSGFAAEAQPIKPTAQTALPAPDMTTP